MSIEGIFSDTWDFLREIIDGIIPVTIDSQLSLSISFYLLLKRFLMLIKSYLNNTKQSEKMVKNPSLTSVTNLLLNNSPANNKNKLNKTKYSPFIQRYTSSTNKCMYCWGTREKERHSPSLKNLCNHHLLNQMSI